MMDEELEELPAQFYVLLTLYTSVEYLRSASVRLLKNWLVLITYQRSP